MLEPLIRWNIFSHLVVPCALLLTTLPSIIAAKMPVYMSGKSPLLAGKTIYIGEKRYKIRWDGRYVFKKIPMGKHDIAVGESSGVIKIKRKRNIDGILFDSNEEGQVLYIGLNIRARELYFWVNGKQLKISENRWTAVDNKNRVYVPQGRIKPNENGNKTPGGLSISANGEIDITPSTKKR